MIELLSARMPPFTDHRESLMQLRPRHLSQIATLANIESLSISQLRHQLVEHYDYFFGPLRAEEVPSDISIRKPWVVGMLIDLIQARRDWLHRRAQLESMY
jgi:hypothetical protein